MAPSVTATTAVNMAKCFREVKKGPPGAGGQGLRRDHQGRGPVVVLNSVGGAMGALYGTLFLRMAAAVQGRAELDLAAVTAMFQAGEKGILEMGKAKVGDKTLVDTLHPAVRALEAADREGKRLADALADFVAAAEAGMKSTTDLMARMGRSSRLGERSIGHQGRPGPPRVTSFSAPWRKGWHPADQRGCPAPKGHSRAGRRPLPSMAKGALSGPLLRVPCRGERGRFRSLFQVSTGFLRSCPQAVSPDSLARIRPVWIESGGFNRC